MSKNDDIIRVWTGDDNSPAVNHWYMDGGNEGEWIFCCKGCITPHETFCLNDEEHRPRGIPTNSLEGLIGKAG